jgi:4-amino-4-deoxy-L-arabinose transferase-like glycosyltransferase
MLQAKRSLISSDGIQMTKNSNTFYLFVLVGILVARVLFDVVNQIEVHFDEAQYWVWSQNPSLSYLSKGPLIPSLIAISNKVLGQTYLGLKFFSYAAYLGTVITLSLAAFKLTGKKESFYTGLLLSALSPGIFILGGIASTDIFLFFFWSLTILCYVCFIKDRDEKWFYVIGISTGLGILAKLTMVLLPLSILLYFLATDLRKYFLNIHIYLSALVTVLISSPILIWNSQNNWLTLFHEIDHLVSEAPTFNPEILLFTLILTVPSVLFLFIKEIREKVFNLKFDYLIYPIFLMIIFFIVKSFTGKIQLNWSIPVFLGLVPILANAISGLNFRAIILSCLFLGPIFLLSNNGVSSLIMNYDPLHPIRGWNETYEDLFQDEDYDYLATEDYTLLSTAAYFQGDAQNLFLIKSSDRRLTHYDLWKIDRNPSDKILFVAYSDSEVPSNNLDCTEIREVKNFPRKHLTLYNCTSK